jgi:chemotaxis protein MotB
MSKGFGETPPIRIVKKKVGHGGHHGGAWKVAYADFVTAMMALFIVLWIVGQNKKVKESVSEYFKDPIAFMDGLSKGAGKLQTPLPDTAAGSQLKDAAERILQEISGKPELAGLAAQIKMEIVKEGLRIELVEKSESYFFDVGTADLKPEAAEILGIIAAQIGTLKNHLVLEGHTDSRQYSRIDGYTNYELSTDRANSARRVLVRNGVALKQIDEVRGCADSQLRDTADPYAVTNRRISILIKYVSDNSSSAGVHESSSQAGDNSGG